MLWFTHLLSGLSFTKSLVSNLPALIRKVEIRNVYNGPSGLSSHTLSSSSGSGSDLIHCRCCGRWSDEVRSSEVTSILDFRLQTLVKWKPGRRKLKNGSAKNRFCSDKRPKGLVSRKSLVKVLKTKKKVSQAPRRAQKSRTHVSPCLMSCHYILPPCVKNLAEWTRTARCMSHWRWNNQQMRNWGPDP